jgi:hypothetical protein
MFFVYPCALIRRFLIRRMRHLQISIVNQVDYLRLAAVAKALGMYLSQSLTFVATLTIQSAYNCCVIQVSSGIGIYLFMIDMLKESTVDGMETHATTNKEPLRCYQPGSVPG